MGAVSAIAHQIQLAVAPVFLLAGVGALLNVVAQRLARVVDRSRSVTAQVESLDADRRADAEAELDLLDRRMTYANLSISCCTASALFVCIVVALLFVSDPSAGSIARILAGLFIAAMTLLILGLCLFLLEIRYAMRSLRLRRGQRIRRL